MTPQVLHAAFIPFGDITQIEIPSDPTSSTITSFLLHIIRCVRVQFLFLLLLALNILLTRTDFFILDAPHRGFGFVEFDLAMDAQAALDNMHLSELFGRTIKVNLAKPGKGGAGGMRSGPEKAIWADEDWLKENVMGDDSHLSSAQDQDQAP